MSDEQFFFFYRTRSPFSQWHPCKFTSFDMRPGASLKSLEFSSAEQYMMFNKAVIFKDIGAANRIMATSDPKKQKGIGRSVQNFDEARWNRLARDVVYSGNLMKFKQNPELLDALMATGEKTLVEASPHDKIWGIGVDEFDPLAQNRSTWQGKNWLGEVLTTLRDKLRAGTEGQPNTWST